MQVTPTTCEPLCLLLSLPPLLSTSLFLCVYGPTATHGSCASLLSYWQQHSRQLQGDHRLYHLLTWCRGDRLGTTGLAPLVHRLLAGHPQLQFFRGARYSGLHTAYVAGVVASLVWEGGGWRRGGLTSRQCGRLGLGAFLEQLADLEMDLNTVPHFSYDQFYVLYLKFAALDTREDGVLGRDQLAQFEGGGQLTRWDSTLVQCTLGESPGRWWTECSAGAYLAQTWTSHTSYTSYWRRSPPLYLSLLIV